MPLLQKRFKGAPGGKAALTRLFGGNIGAVETFWDLDFEAIQDREYGAPGARARKMGLPAERRVVPLNGTLSEDDKKELATMTEGIVGNQPSLFSRTAAGQRTTVDVERGEVELKVGGVVQKLRDQRNKSYSGQRGKQAAVDTAPQYLPDTIGDVITLGETAGSVGAQALTGDASKAAQKMEVELGDRSLSKLADQINKSRPPEQTQGPASKAVEQNKASNRSAANY